MKETKAQKGITLVALIITIVVLLILAGVAIGAVKNSDILGYTKNATSEYQKKADEENSLLMGYLEEIEENLPGEKGPIMTEEQLQQLELVRTYFLGEKDEETGERPGVNLTTLIQEPTLDKILTAQPSEIKFKNQAPINDAYNSITVIDARDDEEGYAVTIRYNDGVYKVILETNFTIKSVDVLYHDSDNLGKYVKYDNKLWRILYNDSTNGLQMISEEALEYNGDEFYLGYIDSLIADWSKLDIETAEFKLADLDGNKSLDTNLEKSIYSYNNAIETLNTACKNIVTPSNNIKDVRCVGSNPIDKNSENTTLYTLEGEIVNKKAYSADYNYVSDLDRMTALGIVSPDNRYWLASREVKNYSIYEFGTRSVYNYGDWSSLICRLGSGPEGYCSDELLRPVVILKPDIQFAGSGTEGDPYTF